MPRLDWNVVQELAKEFLGDEGELDAAKRRKRLRILKAAESLFAHHGYRKTSIDDVARQAGVSKGTVYLYFKNKTDLLMHAIAVEKMRYLEQLKPVLEPGLEPRERLAYYLRAVFELVGQMPLVTRLTQGDTEINQVMDDMDQDLRVRSESQRIDFLVQLLEPFAGERGWSRADIEDRAQVMIAILFNAANLMSESSRGGREPAEFASLLSQVLTDGLIGGQSGEQAAKKP